MKLLIEHQIFADHYQFYVFDGDLSPYENMEKWSDEAVKKGYISGSHAIGIGTVAHFNNHRVNVYINDYIRENSKADITHNHELTITSGTIKLTSPAYTKTEEPKSTIPNGVYNVTIIGFNLGKEDEDDLSDEELLQRDDLERYEIHLAKK